MRKYLIIISLMLTCAFCKAQIIPPYFENFDSGPAAGWTHGILYGPIDFWQQSQYFYTDVPNSISRCYLEMPSIDYSDTSKNLYLSFWHKLYSAGISAAVYYSTDSGQNWSLFIPGPNFLSYKFENNGFWQSGSGMQQNSVVSLTSFKGVYDLRIRFVLNSSSPYTGSWIIDDVSISEDYKDIEAVAIEPILGKSKYMTSILVKSYANTFIGIPDTLNITRKTFLSADSIFDPGDELIDSFTQGNTIFSGSIINGLSARTIPMPANAKTGVNYLFQQYDANTTLTEEDENNNVAAGVLIIDSTIELPYITAFDSNDLWYPYNFSTTPSFWEFSPGKFEHIEGTHSGKGAWATNKKAVSTSNSGEHYIESTFINFAADTSLKEINFWYKSTDGPTTSLTQPYFRVKIYSYDSLGQLNSSYQFPPILINMDDEWDFFTMPIPSQYRGRDNKVRFIYGTSYSETDGAVVDDLYIGTPKPDISIERNLLYRYAPAIPGPITLKYMLYNAASVPAPASVTKFYWSTDSLLDVSDIYIGAKNEPALTDTARVWTSHTFNKPTHLIGSYYVIYQIDTGNTVTESREYNNTGYFKIHQVPEVQYPYTTDFEGGDDNWYSYSSLQRNNFVYGIPDTVTSFPAHSGIKAWSYEQAGGITSHNRSHLCSPVFNLTSAQHPVLEFRMIYYNRLNYGNASHQLTSNVSYSEDNGATWKVLDTASNSYNIWYTNASYNSATGIDALHDIQSNTENLMASRENSFPRIPYNGRDCDNVNRMVVEIPQLAGIPQIQFRVNTSNYDTAAKGLVFDDFSIREREIDLEIRGPKKLLIGENPTRIKFNMDVMNTGNYISSSTNIKFFLSEDSVLDGNDITIGDTLLYPVLPDRWQRLTLSMPNQQAPFQKNFLLYQIDPQNLVSEVNEANNTGAWPLNPHYISTFPFYCDFTDSMMEGWFDFSSTPDGLNASGHRFSNRRGEYYTNDETLGTLFSDYSSTTPFIYAESPSFDFTGYDSISISFDLFCTGMTNIEGGNLSHSFNDSEFWGPTGGFNATNWYNSSGTVANISSMGWTGYQVNFKHAVNDISYFKGKHARLRFKYRGSIFQNGNNYGLQIRNFNIYTDVIDYEADNNMDPFIIDTFVRKVTLVQKINNLGPTSGDVTVSEFYASDDNIFDSSDSLVYSAQTIALFNGQSINDTVSFILPAFVHTWPSYIFCKVDGTKLLEETNEQNNTGSFERDISYVGIGMDNENPGINCFIFNNVLYLNFSGYNPAHCNIYVYDINGKLLDKSELHHLNYATYSLGNYSPSTYFIKIQTDKHNRVIPYIPLH